MTEQKTFLETKQQAKEASREVWRKRYGKLPEYLQTGGKYLGIAAVAAAVGVGIGALGIGVGVGVATGMASRYALPHVGRFLSHVLPDKYNPFLNFDKDSKEVVSARDQLETRWKEAAAQGVTYEQFCKRERKLIRKYGREILWDRVYRGATVGVIGFTAFGATGIRSDVLHGGADWISSKLGAGVGDKIIFGDRVLQRLGHAAAVLVGNILDINFNFHFIGTAQAGEATSPKAHFALDGAPQASHAWPVLENLTFENLADLQKQLPSAIQWTESLIEEYERTMDMHDSRCVVELARLKENLADLKAVQADLSHGKQSLLYKAVKTLKGADAGRRPALLKFLLGDTQVGKSLSAIDSDMDENIKIAEFLDFLGSGKVYVGGVVYPFTEFMAQIGIHFPEGQWKLAPRTARMLMELYRDIQDDPRLKGKGIAVTQGDDGNGLEHGHSDTGGHKTGHSFDMVPQGCTISDEYIFVMFSHMYENMLIAHHDPRVVEYFMHKIAEYKASGNSEMANYYQSRLDWAWNPKTGWNPNAREYYNFIYEPGGKLSEAQQEAMRQTLRLKLMSEFGMSQEEANRFVMPLTFGNQALTDGQHFHIWGPPSERPYRPIGMNPALYTPTRATAVASR